MEDQGNTTINNKLARTKEEASGQLICQLKMLRLFSKAKEKDQSNTYELGNQKERRREERSAEESEIRHHSVTQSQALKIL